MDVEWRRFRAQKRREDHWDELGGLPDVDSLFNKEAKAFLDSLVGPSKSCSALL